jgi:hypothetical protein
MSKQRQPLPDIQYPDAVRFEKPSPPKFGVGGSLLSILSLLFMTVFSAIMTVQLLNPAYDFGIGFLPPPQASSALATWTWIPFAFTLFGAAIGVLLELALLLNGTPFQQTLNRFTTFIRNIRLLNLAPVTTSIFFFVCSMTIRDANLRMAFLYAAAMGCFAIGLGLFFGGAQAADGLILVALQIAQIILVLMFGAASGGWTVAGFLILQAIIQLTSLKIGAMTPLTSTAFHVISTISGLMLYRAIIGATALDANFSHEVAISLPAGSLARWAFVFACLAGLALAGSVWPLTRNSWRAVASNALWSLQYFLLVSAKRFPKPHNLSEIYKDGPPKPVKLMPYSQKHPQFMPGALSIPAVDRIERNVRVLKNVLTKAKKAFSAIAILDHVFPQADSNVLPELKPRLEIWSNGSEYWPWIFTRKIFGLTIPGRTLLPTPKPAIAAYKQGQLYAYLTEYGVASTFAKPAAGREDGALVADFRYLETYETKPGYESYGGMAYLRVNSVEKKLELISMVAPGSKVEIPANPHDPDFRRAEAQVVSSMYYAVIAGKHLAEIHMTFNLVEAALHNAFDAQGQFSHPYRTFLYLHVFAHELAEEMTTEHLIQDGAVFTQIFATTHDAMINHLNDTYHRFQYGADEDFEARGAALTMTDGALLPKSCIVWESRYAEIWNRYTRDLVDIIYPDDQSVIDDPYLQDFHAQLCVLLLNPLPARYHDFKTKIGVARFAADTIHHLVIRHQVYGTAGVRASMDPRISQTQVPRDGGTPPIDEWRSLACVALATARARFTLLRGDWRYLLDGVDSKYNDRMSEVFNHLQEDLLKLEDDWTNTDEDKQYNYDYFRVLPNVLHTGAGY